MRKMMTVALIGSFLACSMVVGFADDAEGTSDKAAVEKSTEAAEEVKILAGEDEKPTTNAKYTPDVFDIGVNGELFFRIRAEAAGFSPHQRARIVNTRLVHILSYGPFDAEAVHIEPVRGKPTIYVGNVRLITVYPSDVEATEAESMEQLANVWAASTACCIENIAPWPHVAAQ